MTLREEWDRKIEGWRESDEEYQRIELALVVGAEVHRLVTDERVSEHDLARLYEVLPKQIYALLGDEESGLPVRELARIAILMGLNLGWDYQRLADSVRPAAKTFRRGWGCEPRPAGTAAEDRTNDLALAA